MPSSSPAPFRSALKRIRSIVRIVKGVGHKYLYKLPSGNAADPWKYFYDEASLRAYLQKKRSDPKRQRERIGDLNLTPLAGSDKAFLITGNTRGHLELMRNLKETLRVGGWNKKHGGWIFPISRRTDIVSRIREYFQKTPPAPNETPIPSPGLSNALSEAMKGNQNAAGPRQNTVPTDTARRPLGLQSYFQQLVSQAARPGRKLAGLQASFQWAPGVTAQLAFLQDPQSKQYYVKIEYPSTTGQPDPNSLRIEKNKRGQWEISEYYEEGRYIRGDYQKHTVAGILDRSAPIQRIVDQFYGAPARAEISPQETAAGIATLSNAMTELRAAYVEGQARERQRGPQKHDANVTTSDGYRLRIEPMDSDLVFVFVKPPVASRESDFGYDVAIGPDGSWQVGDSNYVRNEEDRARATQRLAAWISEPGLLERAKVELRRGPQLVPQFPGREERLLARLGIRPRAARSGPPTSAQTSPNETPLTSNARSEALRGNQNAAGSRGKPRNAFDQLIRNYGGIEKLKDQYISIENEPYMRLVIEHVGQSPRGYPAVSVAHYGEQNGDAMRDPEMLFEIDENGAWAPYYYRNDYSGLEQEVYTTDEDGKVIGHRPRLRASLRSVAATWSRNLRAQGFPAALRKTMTQTAAPEGSPPAAESGNVSSPVVTDIATGPELQESPPRTSPPEIPPLAGMGVMGWSRSPNPPAAINPADEKRAKKKTIRAGVDAGRERVSLKEQQRINIAAKEILARVVDGRLLTDEERETLRKYEGEGGQARNESNDYVGKGLLYEFYTPQPVIDKAWELISRYVPKGARVLEPAAGTGRWAEGKSKDYQFHMLEIDETSSKIARLLHPEATVDSSPFEKMFLDDRNRSVKEFRGTKFQAVVGNPPYGAMGGAWKASEGKGWQRYEEYFLHRSLDAAEEGGILAMVVPSSFLRKGMTAAKQRIFDKAELLEAYRLPNGSFTHTDIGTDLVILRKNTTAEKRSGVEVGDAYFAANPDHVLGEVEQRKNRFGELEPYVRGSIDAFLKLKARDPQPLSLAHKAAIAEALKGNQNAAGKRAAIGRQKTAVKIAKNAARRKKGESRPPSESAEVPKRLFSQSEFNEKYKIGFDARDLEILKKTSATGVIDPSEPFDAERMALEGGAHIPLYLYTTGNIREKLNRLERDRDEIIAAHGTEQYDRQKGLLESALPPPIPIEDIVLSPIDPFARSFQLTGDSGDPVPLTVRFNTWVSNLEHRFFRAKGIDRDDIYDYVDGTPVRGKDAKENETRRKRRKEVGNQLFLQFLREGLTGSEAKSLADEWNRTYYSHAPIRPGRIPVLADHLNTEFKGKPYDLRDVQLDFIASFTARGIGCAVHEVGLGKTMTGIISTVNNMLLGRTRRPLIVVPTSVLAKWEAEFRSLYPDVPLNVIGTPELNARTKGGAKFDVPESSVTILSYDAFERFGFSQERFETLTRDLGDQIANPDAGPKTKRQQAAAEAKVEGLSSKALVGAQDQFAFDEVGFDHICVDEAHNFNNIFIDAKSDRTAKAEANEFKGVLGAGTPSNRGVKLWLAARHILRENQNRNVLLLTATPFTNNPLQAYSLLSLMAKERLEKLGIHSVKDFVAAFIETQFEDVMEANGEIKNRQTVRRFKNGHAFTALINEFFDRKSGEDANIKRPDLIEKEIILPMTGEMESIRDALEALYDEGLQKAKQGGGKAAGGSLLKSMSLQQLQNISPAIINDEDFNTLGTADVVARSPKLTFVTQSVSGFYKEHSRLQPDRPVPGQIIFLPRGVEHMQQLKDALVAQGVPAEAIQLMRPKEKKDRALDRDKARAGVSRFVEIMEDFNDPNGTTKIVIGTDAIQEGVDLNGNTAIGYNCMLDWNPTSNEQKKGRGWRFGNRQERFHMFYPLIENSIDTKLYQKHAEKVSRINDLFKTSGKAFIETADINPDEIKLDLIRDPFRKARMKIVQETTSKQAALEELRVDEAGLAALLDAATLGPEIEASENNIALYKSHIEAGRDFYKSYLVDAQRRLASDKRKMERALQRMEERGSTVESLQDEITRLRQRIESATAEVAAIESKESEYAQGYKADAQRAEKERPNQSVEDMARQHVQALVASVLGQAVYKSRFSIFRLSVQKSVLSFLNERARRTQRRSENRRVPAARRPVPTTGLRNPRRDLRKRGQTRNR